jgi:hypothetical protein
MRLVLIAAIAACSQPGHHGGGSDADTHGSDGSNADATSFRDDDGDGLDDATELAIANQYMPYVSIDPNDGCALGGMLVRVRPHPADPTKILIVYDHLYQEDCGFNGHVGDDESFGVAIDPTRPAPAGILAIRAVSHEGTLCERDTECATCSGDARPACDLAPIGGAMWPVAYASKAKHGNYATLAGCSALATCFDSCTLAAAPATLPVVNAGEPAHHLVSDLTTQGFITAANGWTEPTLMHFDPWDPTQTFGGAANIAADLQDAAYEVAPCR